MTTQPTLPNNSSQKNSSSSAIIIPNNSINQPGFILTNNGQHLTTSLTSTNQGQPFMFAPGTQMNTVNSANLGKRPQFVSLALDGGLITYAPGNLVGTQQQVIRTSSYNPMIPASLPQNSIQASPQSIPPGSTIFMSPVIGQTSVSNQLIQNNRLPNQQHFAFATPTLATVAMLPNGQFCVTQNQSSHVGIQSSSIQAPKDLKQITSKPAVSPLTKQVKSEPNPSEVLKQLNVQIENLTNLPVLTEAQTKRLNELKVVHEKLVKATANKKIAKEKAKGGSLPDNDESSNDSSLQKNPVIQPANASKKLLASNRSNIPNSVRMDIFNKLQANNLLPKCALGTALADTFIVEFRMTNNRYQLRMTRQQKESMEKLLFGQPPKKQSEFLSIFQQEQAKLPIGLPATPRLAQNLVNQPATAQPMIQPNLNLTVQHPQQSFFINGQQVAFTPSLQHATATQQISNSTPVSVKTSSGTQLIPSSPTIGSKIPPPNGAGMQTPFRFITTSQIATTTAAYTPACISANGHYFQVPINMTNASQAALQAGNICIRPPLMTSNGPIVNPNTTILPTNIQQAGKTLVSQAPIPNVPGIPLTPQQTKIMVDLRRMYSDDVAKLSTHGQLMGAKMVSEKPRDVFEDLYYYHVAQDHDNTPEAMAKTDTILEEAISAIMEKKAATLKLIDEITFCEANLHHSISDDHPLDKYLSQRLTYELERENFEGEKSLLVRINSSISVAQESGDYKDLDDSRFSDLSTLKCKIDSASEKFTELSSESSIEQNANCYIPPLPKPRQSLKRQRNKSMKTATYKSRYKFLENYRRFLGPIIDFPLDMDLDLKEADFKFPQVDEILQSWEDNPEPLTATTNPNRLDSMDMKKSNSVKSFEGGTNCPSSPRATSSCNLDPDQNSYLLWDEDVGENSNSQSILNNNNSFCDGRRVMSNCRTRSDSQLDNEDTIGSSSSTGNPKSIRNHHNPDEDEMALMRSLEEAANDIEYLDSRMIVSSPNPGQANNNNYPPATTTVIACPNQTYEDSFMKMDVTSTTEYFDEDLIDSSSACQGVHSEDPDIDAAVRSILSPSI